jgi:hypothetical protein
LRTNFADFSQPSFRLQQQVAFLTSFDCSGARSGRHGRSLLVGLLHLSVVLKDEFFTIYIPEHHKAESILCPFWLPSSDRLLRLIIAFSALHEARALMAKLSVPKTPPPTPEVWPSGNLAH